MYVVGRISLASHIQQIIPSKMSSVQSELVFRSVYLAGHMQSIIHAHIYICMYIYRHARTYVCISTHVCTIHVHTYIHCTSMHVCIHIATRSDNYTNMHTSDSLCWQTDLTVESDDPVTMTCSLYCRHSTDPV